MPAVRHDATCECCRPAPATQSLDEVSWERSAAAAAQRGDLFRVKQLASRNPGALDDDGCGGASGYTPLIYAAREGHADVVQLLLGMGADPSAATRAGGATALHRAAYMGHEGIVRMLLASGADPAQLDADGQTALHKAVQQGHQAVAAMLLQASTQLAAIRDRRGRLAADMAPG